MAQTELMEYQGFHLRAMLSPGGDWVGEATDSDIPQLTAETRDDLFLQFRMVIDAVAEAEAGLEDTDLPDPRLESFRS